ncbi:MAG: tRNA (cytidine(34)-2'-O)-methyltransferase [Eubacteriales bacterium]
MPKLNIVLLEPEIPQNTGNIARTCVATGSSLHLIRPFGFELTDKNLKRAGLDYWRYLDLSCYDSLSHFDAAHNGAERRYFTTKAEKCYTEATYPEDVFLFFGKETKGLPEELLVKNKPDCVRIPMFGEVRSLNLSNAVAVAVYEFYRRQGFEPLNKSGDFPEKKL